MTTLAGSFVALALLSAPNVDRADCANAADRYSASVARVMEALHAYEKCVANSAKHHDCAAEMQALDDAHDNFTDAVADAGSCE